MTSFLKQSEWILLTLLPLIEAFIYAAYSATLDISLCMQSAWFNVLFILRMMTIFSVNETCMVCRGNTKS